MGRAWRGRRRERIRRIMYVVMKRGPYSRGRGGWERRRWVTTRGTPVRSPLPIDLCSASTDRVEPTIASAAVVLGASKRASDPSLDGRCANSLLPFLFTDDAFSVQFFRRLPLTHLLYKPDPSRCSFPTTLAAFEPATSTFVSRAVCSCPYQHPPPFLVSEIKSSSSSHNDNPLDHFRLFHFWGHTVCDLETTTTNYTPWKVLALLLKHSPT